jgi:hypothetical protein
MRRALLTAAVPVAAAFALVGPVCFRPIWDTDTGWHLAVGRLILNSGIPRTNALSWVARDEPWYATSWLFDLVAQTLNARLGPLGVQLFVAALLAVALLAWAAALWFADPLGPWLLPAGALSLYLRVTHRPHVATWTALALVLALCLRGRGRGTGHRFACALVVAVIGNLHAGAAFAAGVAGLFCLEEFARTRRRAELWAAAACGLAVLANPGTLYNAHYLLLHLHVQEVVRLKEFEPARWGQETVFLVTLPLALLAFALRRRDAGFALPISCAVLAFLGLRANRVAYDSMFVLLPLVAMGLAPLRARIGGRATVLLLLVCGAASAATQGYASSLLVARPGAWWNERDLPVRAASFIAAEGLAGRRFNGLRDGGYLEYALPHDPSFADGRIQAFPVSFWRDFQEADQHADSLRAWLVGLGVEWAVASRIRERLTGFRQFDAPEWALVYWDTTNEIWLRRDVPRFSSLIARAEYRHFRPYGDVLGAVRQAPRAELPAFAAEVARFESTAPGDPFALLIRCAVAVRSGAPGRDALCDAAAADGSVRALVAKARAFSPAE